MIFYDPDDSEGLLVAKAETAPIAVLAEMVAEYKQQILPDMWQATSKPLKSSQRFERAVLSRNDGFINLILAGAATDERVAHRLWEISEEGASNESYTEQLKSELLKGPALQELMVERTWGGPRRAKFSLVELLSGDDYPTMRKVIGNPYCTYFFGSILYGEGEFELIPSEKLPYIFGMMSANLALNTKSVGYGARGFEATIRDAPLDFNWYSGIKAVISQIERDNLTFHQTPIRDFCNKWLGYKFEDIAPIVERGGGSLPSKGTYTSLNDLEEFVSLFCAKFGRVLILQHTYPKVFSQPSVSEILASGDFMLKAAFFGNADLTTGELDEALRSASDFNILYWLIFNDSVMLNPASRLLLSERLGVERRTVFERRSEYLKSENPQSFWVERVIEENRNLPEKFVRNLTEIPQKVALIESRILDVEKMVKWIIILIGIAWIGATIVLS
jgi:hypothetical protein